MTNKHPFSAGQPIEPYKAGAWRDDGKTIGPSVTLPRPRNHKPAAGSSQSGWPAGPEVGYFVHTPLHKTDSSFRGVKGVRAIPALPLGGIHCSKPVLELATPRLGDRCVVCQTGRADHSLIPCGHSFCLQCILGWGDTLCDLGRPIPMPTGSLSGQLDLAIMFAAGEVRALCPGCLIPWGSVVRLTSFVISHKDHEWGRLEEWVDLLQQPEPEG